MMGVAAGLATCGKKPFANTFAMFAAGRAFEQVRNSVAYPHLNVKVVGSHGGLSVGEDGATHQCCEDFATMRSIPGMVVCCPCDGNEMTPGRPGPAGLRRPRLPASGPPGGGDRHRRHPRLHVRAGQGRHPAGRQRRDHRRRRPHGPGGPEGRRHAGRGGHSARVIDMHTIKPLDEELVLRAARETGCIVTTEEHNILGGLGEAVCRLSLRRVPRARGAPRRQRRVRPLRQGARRCWSTTASPPRGSRQGPRRSGPEKAHDPSDCHRYGRHPSGARPCDHFAPQPLGPARRVGPGRASVLASGRAWGLVADAVEQLGCWITPSSRERRRRAGCKESPGRLYRKFAWDQAAVIVRLLDGNACLLRFIVQGRTTLSGGI